MHKTCSVLVFGAVSPELKSNYIDKMLNFIIAVFYCSAHLSPVIIDRWSFHIARFQSVLLTFKIGNIKLRLVLCYSHSHHEGTQK